MYVVTPFPNVAYAFDLSKPGAPLRWKFRPDNSQAAKAEACCDVVNRGAAYADGALYYNLLDGHTVAVDAATGVERWRTHVADVNRGETMTMAPLVVHGNVIVGPSGGEMGVRGWIAALDARTGRERWRAYNLGPDSDVKIGPRFQPFYQSERGRDLAATSWPAGGWVHGGGAAWGWLTYDPVLNLLYYGTSNPGPWIGEMRPGDNKYTSSILARDPDTGELTVGAAGHARTTSGTMTRSMRTFWRTFRSAAPLVTSWCTSIGTDSPTPSIGKPVKCWSRRPLFQSTGRAASTWRPGAHA